MTAHARISQADIERATKAAAKVGGGRIVLDLQRARIEIVLGETASTPVGDNWDDTDV